MEQLKNENIQLKEENLMLEKTVGEQLFTPENLLKSNDHAKFYTGFPSIEGYNAFTKFMMKKGGDNLIYWRGPSVDYTVTDTKPKDRKLTPELELFAVMVRLRVGLLSKDIAARLGISVSHFSRTFTSWIRFLHLVLKDLCRFPSRQEVRELIPATCRDFKNIRAIIDCTEFFIEKPSSLTAQRQTWSSYKQHNTAKVKTIKSSSSSSSYLISS